MYENQDLLVEAILEDWRIQLLLNLAQQFLNHQKLPRC